MRPTISISGVAGLIVALTIVFARTALAQTDTEIVLPITINAIRAGETPAIISGDDIYVPVSTLARGRVSGISWERVLTVARLRNAERMIGEEPAVSLRSLAPWTTFELREEDLTLAVTLDPHLLGSSMMVIEDARPADLKYSADKSSFLNYAVTSTGFSNISTFAELGSSIGGNLFYTSLASAPGAGVTRGITNYTIDQRDQLRRMIFGDASIITDELGGAGIIGGATLARSFELDPYFIRFPSMSLRGIATTPSEVDVYVNGVLVERRTVPPGPFELANIPASSGTSAATVVVRDAFGREQVQTSSFYYSTGVLGRGLSEYDYSAGFVRDLEGSFDYDDPVVVGFHRYGVTDNFTIGGRVEATESLVSGGPSLAFASRLGELDLKLAASSSDGRTGMAAQFGFRRLSRRTNFAGTVRLRSRDYANFSLLPERDRALEEATLFGSYLPSWGNIGLQWTTTDMRDATDRQRLALLTNVAVGNRASLLFSAAAVEEGNERFGEYFVGFSIRAFGESTLNVAAHSRDGVGTATTELQRPLPVGTGWGYRLHNTTGDGNTINSASIQYQNDFGRYEINVDPEDAGDASLTAAGGIVYQNGKIVATRPVAQSFALVRVPGVEGVRVYLSNQLVGRTDERGDLLVPNLLPYYGNRIRIDDRDVPMNYDIQIIEQTIAPPERGGALVVFPAREIRAAVGSLAVKAADGEVVPSYGEIRITRDGAENVSPIGGTGDFYFENVSPGSYDATIIFEKGSCSFELVVPNLRDDIIDLGRVVCRGVTP